MNIDSIIKRYYPMTETAFYILGAFVYERYGYETIKHVERITGGRLQIGAGTIYSTISKFEKDGLIECVGKEGRRKLYVITSEGKNLLTGVCQERCRINLILFELMPI